MLKKIFALATLFFFTASNSCFAFSELYYLKNIKTTEIVPVVEDGLRKYSFNIVKYDPYYSISSDGASSSVIILQQSGDNMFYYYNSNSNTRVNKYILKEVANRNIVCEQSFNSSIISIYDNLAENIIPQNNETNRYTFNDEEFSGNTPSYAYKSPEQANSFYGRVSQISSGTVLKAYLQNSINTATATKGEQVTAVLTENVTLGNSVVFPQGSLLYGTLSKAGNATYGSRNGRVVINFTSLVTPENKTYQIATEAIDFSVANEGKAKSTIQSAATTAAVGAIVGLVFAMLTDSKSKMRTTAISAGVGAGSSLVANLAQKGVDAEIPSYTEIEVTLTQPVTVSVTE
ncbi:MAG: TrbI/VirB10 family protein [bacterium]|nr:TrbI/VirB10 family protein [bacterium]